MATTIVTKSGSGAPTASDLVAGELAVDLTNGRLYTENSGGTVLELGLNPNGNVNVTGSVGIGVVPSAPLTIGYSGAEAQLQINNSGGSRMVYLGAFSENEGIVRLFNSSNVETVRIAAESTAGVHTYFNGGKVGIGTSSPAYTLDVKSSGEADVRIDSATGSDGALRFAENSTNVFTMYHDAANSALAFYDNANTSERMRIDASGNVGINVADPTHRLEVVKDNTYAVKFGGDGGSSDFSIEIGQSGTSASPGFNATAGSMLFSIAGTEKMRIDTSGNVGIGTSSPASLLHLSSSIPTLSFTDTNSFTDANDRFIVRAAADSGNIQWYDDSASTTTELMTFLPSGKVGLNSASPTDQLEINGGASYPHIRLRSSVNTSRYMRMGMTDATTSTIEANGTSTVINFLTAGSERMRIDASGDLILGSTATLGGATITTVSSGNAHNAMRNSAATAGKFWRQEVDSANIFYILNDATTGVYMSDGGTTWVAISDETVKENIVEIEGALDKVMDYRCVEYNLIADENKAKKIGFIAQDWEVDYSPVVVTGADGKLGMQYTETIPVLLKAIQEQQAIIEALTARIEALES